MFPTHLIVRVVLFVSLGTLCSVLGFKWDTLEFWSFLGLFWCVDTLSRTEGRQEGVSTILDMPMLHIASLKALLDRADAGEEITEEELKKEMDKHDDV